MRKTGAPRLPTLIMSDTGKMARVKIMFAYGFADIPGATGNDSYIFCQSLHSNPFPPHEAQNRYQEPQESPANPGSYSIIRVRCRTRFPVRSLHPGFSIERTSLSIIQPGSWWKLLALQQDFHKLCRHFFHAIFSLTRIYSPINFLNSFSSMILFFCFFALSRVPPGFSPATT